MAIYAADVDPVDDYIENCREAVRPTLSAVRETIRAELPDDAVECLRWRMPTYQLDGTNVIHFAAAKSHLGIYPSPEAIVEFAPQLTEYTTSKGAIQFPFDRPTPYDLIGTIAAWRVAQIRPALPK